MTRRLIGWAAVIALTLLVPLALTRLGSGVEGDGFHWVLFDFVFMGTLMFAGALAYEWLSHKGRTTSYRVAVGLAVAAVFLLIWITGAVII